MNHQDDNVAKFPAYQPQDTYEAVYLANKYKNPRLDYGDYFVPVIIGLLAFGSWLGGIIFPD